MKAPTRDSNPDDDFAEFCGLVVVFVVPLACVVLGGIVAALACNLR